MVGGRARLVDRLDTDRFDLSPHRHRLVVLMDFYLGTHIPAWLARKDVPPLFVSHRRLRARRGFPRATTRWALDSGGFTELSLHGSWTTDAATYAAAVSRYSCEIGGLQWAAPQDWMCEPWIVSKTGRTVTEHQQLTVANYLDLMALDVPVPIIPVLQGWTLGDYMSHVEMYAAAGVDLTSADRVGLGSVCRRQATAEIGQLVERVNALGIRLHGFGVKGAGIRRYGWLLESADSMSWSARGRRVKPCRHGTAASCANCYPFALEWRRRAITQTPRPVQTVGIL